MDTRLPKFCATRNLTGEPAIIKRGEPGYYRGEALSIETDEDIARFNEERGITPGMVEAMVVGSMFGWDCPGATLEKGEEVAQREAAWKASQS